MFNSIRAKLTLWYVGVLALVVIVFAGAAYLILVDALDRDTDQRLVEMARNFDVALKAELEDEDREKASEKALSEAVREMRFRDYQFQILAMDNRVIASTAEFEFGPESRYGTEAFRDIEINNQIMRVYRSPLVNGQNEYRLLVFHSLKEQNALKSRMAGIFLFGAPLTLLLAGLGGYFLARKSLAPVAEMSQQAKNISVLNLNERLSVKNESDELGQLAGVMNNLLERLDASFEQQRRFMADASHELRTPLAIVRGESEIALSKQDRSKSDYQESLAIVHDESKRLTRIVEDLFTLARADAGQFKARFAPVYLDEIVGDSARSIGVLARKKNIKIEVVSNGEMPMSGDESLLRRLFLNMLDNAVKYGRENGSVSVKCETRADSYVVAIADDGIGISSEEQGHIFERFYRVDKARSRSEETENSGAGLGLAIAKWIAEIHRGEIDLISSNENGSVFAVEFIR